MLATTLVSGAAYADNNEEVRAAYDRGKHAYDHADYAKAATEFAAADALVPNDGVLEMAIVSASKADSPVLGMSLVERAQKRGTLEAATKIARDLFAAKVGRVEVQCPSTVKCSATLDGSPLGTSAPEWVRIGEHAIVLESTNNVERFTVQVTPSQTTTVRPAHVIEVHVDSPQATPNPLMVVEPGTEKPLAPAWFWAGVGITAVAAGATVASGIDTLNARDDFHRDRTDADTSSHGERAQTRTNVLIGTTCALAVGTALVGIFAVRWTGARRPTTEVTRAGL